MNRQKVFELLGEDKSHMKTKNQRYGIWQMDRFVQICADQTLISKFHFDKLRVIVLDKGGMQID